MEMGIECPCPPVRNDIVTPRHLLVCPLTVAREIERSLLSSNIGCALALYSIKRENSYVQPNGFGNFSTRHALVVVLL